MFQLMLAAMGGGLATVSVLAPSGWIPAVLSAPIGGSLSALIAAIYLSRQCRDDRQSEFGRDVETDAMVAALRGMAAQGDRSVDAEPVLDRTRRVA